MLVPDIYSLRHKNGMFQETSKFWRNSQLAGNSAQAVSSTES